MKFLAVFLIAGCLSGVVARAEILLKTQADGTAISAELMPGANLEIQLRVALSDGGESIRSDTGADGSASMEGAAVEVKRVLNFPSGEEVQVERKAEVKGNIVEFQDKWEGALLKGGVYLNAFLSSEDLIGAKVEFLGANDEEVAPTASLAPGEKGVVRGLKCHKLKILGWKGRDLTFQFGGPVDCYLYFRKNEAGVEMVDLRVLIQRTGVSSMDFAWSLALVE